MHYQFGLMMEPILWGRVTKLYLSFFAWPEGRPYLGLPFSGGETSLRPAEVLDYLRGQKVAEEF